MCKKRLNLTINLNLNVFHINVKENYYLKNFLLLFMYHNVCYKIHLKNLLMLFFHIQYLQKLIHEFSFFKNY